ncbi:hypothetical protein NO263_13135 [Gluconacetobacter entanii]|uniref:Phage protein n=1 Tax=Gluconacetobacter entanii TaxID=108528 RepID=A0ABT3K7X9_9PROT|nr:hypothetical protein [Gluconacetobacter entanii]MCW4591525.1 hypothetical protein [Gluconacetobacter entanii]MCW4595431.1 hypothetical protein [Gluconacetobacter entanii]NPC89860.1 hypothetical protein [Gluconacetobacter entanii]
MAKPVNQIISRMVELARNASTERGEDVAINLSNRDIKDISGRKRTSARLELNLDQELRKKGIGSRSDDGSFTVFSGGGPEVLSYSEAKKAENDLLNDE